MWRMCLLVWRENSWPMLAGCKWQLLFCFTGTAPAASEQKPHRRHQRRDVHQPSLERQPACLAGVIDIDDCGHNCRKRNLADCSTLVLARAWAPRCKFQLIASYDSIYHHITSILYHRLSSIDMYQYVSMWYFSINTFWPQVAATQTAAPCVHLANPSGCAPPGPTEVPLEDELNSWALKIVYKIP